MYHFQGESLPDRFEFHDGRAVVACSGDFSSEEDQESDRCLSTVKAEEKELDARAVQALADQAVVMDCPSRHAAVGPGTGVPGPRRYIGVLRPVLLFSMMRQWVHEHSLGNAPSWATFRRALKKARVYLSFRKSSGQHATCDHCKWHKARLRSKLSVNERKQEMEKYCHHLLEVWRDRQSDASWVALSVQTSLSVQASLGNARFEYNGVLMLRTDGLDQAKHRMPRILQPQKAVERLPRPVCPVNMCWAHGHCFAFSIQDMDTPKNTATNLENVSRLLSVIYNKYHELPASIHILLDNTCSSNKNQLMMKYWIKVLLLGCCRQVFVRFPLKGHTHNCIDALGGAAVTSCANKEFSTPEELVEIYKAFLLAI